MQSTKKSETGRVLRSLSKIYVKHDFSANHSSTTINIVNEHLEYLNGVIYQTDGASWLSKFCLFSYESFAT
jgi:hypothetical protein